MLFLEIPATSETIYQFGRLVTFFSDFLIRIGPDVLANYRLALIEHQTYHRFALGFNATYILGQWPPFSRPTLQN